MSKQQGKSQRISRSIEGFGRTLDMYRTVAIAGVAISVIIMQAFFGTGITDSYIFGSVICFAIAIPLLTLYVFVTSTPPKPKSHAVLMSLFVIFIVGGSACGSGVVSAFHHLSPLAGNVFGITLIISIILAVLMWLVNVRSMLNDKRFPEHL